MEVHSKHNKTFWRNQVTLGIIYGSCLAASIFCVLYFDKYSLYYWAGFAMSLMTILHIKGQLEINFVRIHVMENQVKVTNFIFKRSYTIFYDQIDNIQSTIEVSGKANAFQSTTITLENKKTLEISTAQYSNYYELKEAILLNRKPVDLD